MGRGVRRRKLTTPQLIPVVLCGGKSRRFGRDKLVEPLEDGTLLIERAIAAFAEIGTRPLLAGRCDAAISARYGPEIPDAPGAGGPGAGILAAIEACGKDVLVLAGDLPCVTTATVALLVEGARANPHALVVLGLTDDPQPCMGVYRVGAAPTLRAWLGQDRRRPLGELFQHPQRALVGIPMRDAVNVNTAADLSGHFSRPVPKSGTC